MNATMPSHTHSRFPEESFCISRRPAISSIHHPISLGSISNPIPWACKIAKGKHYLPSHRSDQDFINLDLLSDFGVEIVCRWNTIRYLPDNQSHEDDWLMKMWLAATRISTTQSPAYPTFI
jgi:hypothetical protein